MLLHENFAQAHYMDIISDPTHMAQVPTDNYLGTDWSKTQKAMYLRFAVARLRRRGVAVHFGKGYNNPISEIKPLEDFRSVPVAELDSRNNIYVNAQEIGFSLSFLSLLCLYGHRVQIEQVKQQPDSPEAILYRNARQCVERLMPDGSSEMDDLYKELTGRPDADYAADMLTVERQAFAYGLGVLKGQPKLDARIQYAANTYIATSSLSQVPGYIESEDFRERFVRVYSRFEQNLGAILPGFMPIKPKATPFRKFDWAPYGAVVYSG